jgi:hypothetical protein
MDDLNQTDQTDTSTSAGATSTDQTTTGDTTTTDAPVVRTRTKPTDDTTANDPVDETATGDAATTAEEAPAADPAPEASADAPVPDAPVAQAEVVDAAVVDAAATDATAGEAPLQVAHDDVETEQADPVSIAAAPDAQPLVDDNGNPFIVALGHLSIYSLIEDIKRLISGRYTELEVKPSAKIVHTHMRPIEDGEDQLCAYEDEGSYPVTLLSV